MEKIRTELIFRETVHLNHKYWPSSPGYSLVLNKAFSLSNVTGKCNMCPCYVIANPVMRYSFSTHFKLYLFSRYVFPAFMKFWLTKIRAAQLFAPGCHTFLTYWKLLIFLRGNIFCPSAPTPTNILPKPTTSLIDVNAHNFPGKTGGVRRRPRFTYSLIVFSPAFIKFW